jgi:thiol-disulfide isomerase/thioredoxin
MLGLIAFFGQKLTLHLGWAANPHGLFKKILGWLLIIVGLMIITGFEKKIEVKLIDAGFGTTKIEESLLDDMKETREVPTEGAEPEGQELSPEVNLPRLYKAPEFQGLSNWINSDPIASIEDLKGKVVLVDFWTYSCINCIRTLPFIQSWHEKYADKGLVIIGIHAPEFQFEKIYENVVDATQKFGITYPVVQDNDFGTWRAYNNRYWPAKYLIDKDGYVRFTHFGEGEYAETEANIVALLGAEMKQTEVQGVSVDYTKIGTGETYIGSARATNFVAPDKTLDNNEWTLDGDWNISGESATNGESEAKIRMKFTAAVANLVMGGNGTAEVYIDGKLADNTNAGSDVKDGILTLDGQRLYELANFGGQYGTHDIEVIFKEPGVELFAWTFG